MRPDEHIIMYRSTICNSGCPSGWIETNLGYYGLVGISCDYGYLSKSDVGLILYDPQDRDRDLSDWSDIDERKAAALPQHKILITNVY